MAEMGTHIAPSDDACDRRRSGSLAPRWIASTEPRGWVRIASTRAPASGSICTAPNDCPSKCQARSTPVATQQSDSPWHATERRSASRARP